MARVIFLNALIILSIIAGFLLPIAESTQEKDAKKPLMIEALWDKVRPAMQNAWNKAGEKVKQMHLAVNDVMLVLKTAIEEDCEEIPCPHGYTKGLNTSHVMSHNGCGAFGIKWRTKYLPDEAIEHCCNGHDLCYDTCGADRDICDVDFKRCLFGVCKRPGIPEAKVIACKVAAKLMYVGVHASGCRAFQEAQKNACMCIPPQIRTTEL